MFDEHQSPFLFSSDIGYSDREHLSGKAPLVIRFKICDVYPGTKYKDTAITEIYFDGIDVH